MSATCGKLGVIEFVGPRMPEFSAELKAKANGFDLPALAEELLHDAGSQEGNRFQDITSFLKRLPNADFTKKL